MELKARVLSLGAGVQSSALLLAYLEGKLENPPDFAVFADTQAEPDYVYTWLERLKAVAKNKIPIYTPTNGNILADPKLRKSRSASIPFFLKNEDGSQGLGRRQCTYDYKIMVIDKEIRKQLGYAPRKWMKHKVEVLIGISTDEAQRMKDAREKWKTNRYPLIEELGWNRGQCIEYVKESGLGAPPKSACYICPYRSNASWRELKKAEPHNFQRAVQFEKDMQAAELAKLERGQTAFKSVPYIHRSMKPLDEVDFDALAPDMGPGLFGNDCEGMCGV